MNAEINDDMLFARRMRVVQQMLGLSDQQAAADCGVTLATYRRYMTGATMRTMPS
jgi:DNA-directed RNA polymerase specialized sigma24 family protein